MFTLMFIIFNVMLFCCWKKVKIAIAVIDATADFLVATFRLSVVNFLYAIVFIGLLMMFVATSLATVSMNDIQADSTSPIGKTWTWNSTYFGLYAFVIVGFIWIFSYVFDQISFIVMSCAAQFYFTSNADQTGEASVVASICLANTKHMGSIAAGSGIHTILVIFHFFNEIMQQAAHDSDNAAAKVMACCINCCFTFLESLIEHLTTLSYAMTAIPGESYCTAAWNGFLLNLKHCIKFYFAITIAKMFVFLGMVGVVCANSFSGYLILQYAFPEELREVHSVYAPVAAIAVTTYLTTFLFLSPFNEAVVATLLCFAVDAELNNGKPQFGSPSYQVKLKEIEEGEGPQDFTGIAPQANYQNQAPPSFVAEESQPLANQNGHISESGMNYHTGYQQ